MQYIVVPLLCSSSTLPLKNGAKMTFIRYSVLFAFAFFFRPHCSLAFWTYHSEPFLRTAAGRQTPFALGSPQYTTLGPISIFSLLEVFPMGCVFFFAFFYFFFFFFARSDSAGPLRRRFDTFKPEFMGISKEVLELQLAAEDPDLCRDKAVELLKEGKAALSAEWCVHT